MRRYDDLVIVVPVGAQGTHLIFLLVQRAVSFSLNLWLTSRRRLRPLLRHLIVREVVVRIQVGQRARRVATQLLKQRLFLSLLSLFARCTCATLPARALLLVVRHGYFVLLLEQLPVHLPHKYVQLA